MPLRSFQTDWGHWPEGCEWYGVRSMKNECMLLLKNRIDEDDALPPHVMSYYRRTTYTDKIKSNEMREEMMIGQPNSISTTTTSWLLMMIYI